jgi:outer membrane protein OmpA-like peptidoglycan-associated protein
MENRKLIGSPIMWAIAAVASVGLIAAAGGPALAQSAAFDSGDPAITVDLSVLQGGSFAGGPRSPMPTAPGFGGRLLVPGAEVPSSRLYVKPRGGVAESLPAGTERPAATAGRAPTMPPAKAPISSTQAPAKAAPPEPDVATPSQPRPAPAAPAPAEPQSLASAPPPPAVDKPQAVAAAPKVTASSNAPPPPAIEKPQAAAPKPTAPVAPPAATEKPQAAAPVVERPRAPAPQAPAIAVPTPPPPPPAATGVAVAAAPAVPAASQQAALPKAGASAQTGETIKVIFEAEEAKLSEQARGELKSMVQGILERPNLRVQLLAYAGGESLSSSKARRLSLSRALAVRSHLIENGLRSTRIDVRALGDKYTEEPANRVDVNIVER